MPAKADGVSNPTTTATEVIRWLKNRSGTSGSRWRASTTTKVASRTAQPPRLPRMTGESHP
jgi:hypothetical protein